jgi:hypothetical protein
LKLKVRKDSQVNRHTSPKIADDGYDQQSDCESKSESISPWFLCSCPLLRVVAGEKVPLTEVQEWLSRTAVVTAVAAVSLLW